MTPRAARVDLTATGAEQYPKEGNARPRATVPDAVLDTAHMNIPNQLSLFRILLAPGVLACLVYYHPERDWLRYLALGLFALGILTDALDGFIARTQNQRTKLGIILDPIADKLLILCTLIGCSTIRALPEALRIPAWFNIIVLSRDAIVVIGAIVLYIIRNHWDVQPNLLGKCTTVAQMFVIPTVLLALPVKEALLIVASVLTVLSTFSYLRVGVRLLD